ncbi:MAG: adenylosuccinate synthase [Synergistaceae bacterium]|nr:adenylosuccinate synthase [Synergistaceae bacterium]
MAGQVDVIIGAQWGDEGKGRIVDALAGRMDVVVRYQGGANAGHTVIVGDEKHIFHLLPSGMLYSGRTCVIGNGVVIDPDQLLRELQELQEKGKDRACLVVSGAAHVVMPYHKVLDGLDEKFRGKDRQIGTTRRGIGPCYVDKYNRVGIRVEDLLDADVLREKLSFNLEVKNLILSRVYDESPLAFDELFEKALAWGKVLAPYVGDASLVVDEALREGKSILLEGAQGTLLDADHGTYPFVTSSHPTASGGCLGAGVGPTRIDRVIGIVKAYCTRVGDGPFPTEDLGDKGAYLREKGAEFGATTGRPRRCGWLDMVALRYAVRVNGMTAIALTKLDVLDGLEEIKICTAYEIDGKRQEHFTGNSVALAKARPVYESLPGWKDRIGSCRSFEELPKEARDYIATIEKMAGVPVVLIGVGPKREETILRGL